MLSGDEVDAKDITSLAAVVDNVSVFYRASPKHKLKIVKVGPTPKVTSGVYNYLKKIKLHERE